MYAPDGDVWNNVCVYMMGCAYAICVFEDIDTRDFNPNVAIEYGFLRAMDRRILLLKEQRLPHVRGSSCRSRCHAHQHGSGLHESLPQCV